MFQITHSEVPPTKLGGVVACGPWGGLGGYAFDDGTYKGIRQINLSRNVGIVWIRVLYDHDGDAIWGCKQGGTGGYKSDKVNQDHTTKITLFYLIYKIALNS
jgi:hypothetical protein